MTTGTAMQLSREALLGAYRKMATIRRFEDRVHELFEAGALPGFVHLYAGEEASAVGVCSHLTDDDRICSTHRGHGHCIAKGVDPGGMMLELFGSRDGVCGGKGGSMHIADLSKGMMGANAIVGGGPPLACGAALTHKTLGTGGVAVTFTGDGGSNQGTTFESMNLASVWNLPVIFVFENNGYAESTASSWAVACGDIVNRAEAFGMPGIQVDGFDFFAVHDAAGEAIERSPIEDIYIFGRRGPIEGAFTNVELREMGHLENCAPILDPAQLPDEVVAPHLSERDLRLRTKNVETLRSFLDE